MDVEISSDRNEQQELQLQNEIIEAHRQLMEGGQIGRHLTPSDRARHMEEVAARTENLRSVPNPLEALRQEAACLALIMKLQEDRVQLEEADFAPVSLTGSELGVPAEGIEPEAPPAGPSDETVVIRDENEPEEQVNPHLKLVPSDEFAPEVRAQSPVAPGLRPRLSLVAAYEEERPAKVDSHTSRPRLSAAGLWKILGLIAGRAPREG